MRSQISPGRPVRTVLAGAPWNGALPPVAGIACAKSDHKRGPQGLGAEEEREEMERAVALLLSRRQQKLPLPQAHLLFET